MSNTQSKPILQRAVGAIFLLALIALVAILLLQPSDRLPDSTAKNSKPQQPTISITAHDQNKSPASPDQSGPALVLESVTGTQYPEPGTIAEPVEVISEDLWQSVEQTAGNHNKPANSAPTASREKPTSTANSNIPKDRPKAETKPKAETAKPVVTTPKLELIADSEKSPSTSKPAPSVNSKPSSNGNWYVQVGAFGNTANAQKLVNQYKQQGYNVRIQKDKNLNRVQIGPFATKKEAEQIQSKTKTQSINPAVIHLP